MTVSRARAGAIEQWTERDLSAAAQPMRREEITEGSTTLTSRWTRGE
jgi:hypothetical protein